MYIQQLTSRIPYPLFQLFFHVLLNSNSYTHISALIPPLSYMIVMAISYYRSAISTKSPPTGTGNISERRLMSKVRRVGKVCARKSVCICSQSGGGAIIGLLT